MPGGTRRQFLTVAAAAAAGGIVPAPRRAAASPAWVDQRQAGPFVIHSSFSLAGHEPLLAELPALERELRRVLALRPCREPIGVRLLRDKAEHRAYLHERFADLPYRRALFVKQDGRATVFAYNHEELAIDVRHECTHALLHSDLAMVPLWLDEGLAEYFEMPKPQRAFGHPHAKAVMWDLRFGMLEDLDALEAKKDLQELTAGDYRSAWAWVHFMLHGPRHAAEQLWGFLSDIRRGEPPGALSDRLRAVAPRPKAQLATHFRQWARLASRHHSSAGVALRRGGLC